MARITVGDVASLPPGASVKVVQDGTDVLVANVDGVICAINSVCPHRGGDLSQGVIADGKVTCPKHHAVFDLKTGRNVTAAKIAFKSFKTGNARAYRVTVEDSTITVDTD